jgi:membrane protein DedA with SNARE-associated domain
VLTVAAIISVSGSLGYFLPAIIGLESLGVPSPGETALLLAAVLASQGKLHIWLVIVIAIASAMMGDNVAYLLGRWLGRDVLEAPGPLRNYRIKLIRTGDRFFSKHGSRTVFIGRWITVVRSVVAWLAGINEMPFWEFFFYNAAGAITWATAYGLAGYYGGNAAVDVFKTVGLVAAIVIGVALVGVLAFVEIRKRRRAPETTAAPDTEAPAPKA